ncbi:MAG: FAD-dependent oxidoreductase [Candidatus Burarchaeum sp.]|nr:FAD-dependent oxidoreductase [Candidatus Burarchaeum sp.]MDO8340320.1 FAD-dependent oxidoreductase [Candidatus Burarchaeum sp.]
MAECYDVAIIGGGVTGFSAAMYAGRFELKTAVFAETRGGTIVLSPAVENFPGFEKIVGFDLAEKIMNQALKFGAELKDERVEKVEKKKDGGFALTTKRGEYCAKTVIFTTGTTWKKMGVPGEEKFSGKGVHYCALCDGAFYKGKVIGVVGSGDSAVKESLLLAGYGSKVYLLIRKDAPKAEPVNCRMLEAEKKVEVITKVTVREVKGGGQEGMERVTGVLLDREVNGSRELKLDGLFVAIGHEPLSGLAKSLGAKLNAKGEIVVNRDMETGVPGVYAAGDVVDSKFKQAATGAGEGVTAVHSAYEYLKKKI